LIKDERSNTDKSFVIFDLGYKKGAFRDNSGINLETWSMDYLSGVIVYQYQFKSRNLFSPFVDAGIFSDYLFSGILDDNTDQIDLTQQIRRVNMGITAGLGFATQLKPEFQVMFHFSYSRGLITWRETVSWQGSMDLD